MTEGLLRVAGMATTLGALIFACASLLPLGCATPPSGADRTPTIVSPIGVGATSVATDPAGSCHAAFGRLVSGLRSPLVIDLYATRGVPGVESMIEALRDRLLDPARASGGKLRLVVHDTRSSDEAKEARKAGCAESNIDGARAGSGFLCLAFGHEGERVVVPLLAPSAARGVDFLMAQKIHALRAKVEGDVTRFGFITNKEEIALSEANLVAAGPGSRGPDVRGILRESAPYHALVGVDLRGGEAPIDETLAGIIITQPGVDYTEKELRRIDEFLLRGHKALAVFSGAANVAASDTTMTARLDTHGLERLLLGYGIEMKPEVVLDWARSIQIPVATASGTTLWFRAPAIVQAEHLPELGAPEQTLDSTSPIFFGLDDVAFPFPSTLVAHPERQPRAKVQVVARSTPRTTIETADPVSLKISSDWRANGAFGQRALAISVEGVLESAFPNGSSPPAVSQAESRVLVIAASQFLANPFARAGNPPPNTSAPGDEDLQMLADAYAKKYLAPTIGALMNTLDWMTAERGLLACSTLMLPGVADGSEAARGGGEVLPPPTPSVIESPPPPANASGAPARLLLGAKHLVVMYRGSVRATPGITRTRAEAEARAKEALREYRGGKAFEDIAARYSDEPGAAARGGNLGEFPLGAMVPEFEKALLELPVGELSQVVETRFGFHLILRTR